MRPIRPDQFARIMTLPQDVRTDLLELLGATPVSDRQMDALILRVRQQHKRTKAGGRAPDLRPMTS